MNKFLSLLLLAQFAVLSCSSDRQAKQILDRSCIRHQCIMFQIIIFFILFLMSGCVSQDGETQSHVPVSTLELAVKRFDYPLWEWCGNNTFRVESAVERFEYNMLGHPVIETKLDSVNTCRLIFDTGSAGKLILDRNFAEKSGLINRFCPTEIMKSGWNFKRDIPSMTVKKSVSLSIGNSRVCYSECLIVDGRTLNFLAADGIFSIPNDDARMWEIDCENKLLSVSDYPIFSWQGISLQLDVIGSQYVIREFPFQFRHGNEYVHPRVDLVMDTGSSSSLVYLYSEPDSTMRSALNDEATRKYVCPPKNGVIPTLYQLYEYGLLDRKLWIEHRELLRQWRISGERDMVVAGMDFLKSFNLRLYPAEHRIELIPNAYISLQEDLSRQKGNEEFRFRAFESKEGYAVVDFVKEGSFWQDFGVKEGDVILDVDGHRLFDLHRSYFDKDVPSIHHSFTIARDRDTLFIRTGVPSTFEF